MFSLEDDLDDVFDSILMNGTNKNSLKKEKQLNVNNLKRKLNSLNKHQQRSYRDTF